MTQTEDVAQEWSEWKATHLHSIRPWTLAIETQLLKDELDALANDISMAKLDVNGTNVDCLVVRFNGLFKKFKDTVTIEILKNV